MKALKVLRTKILLFLFLCLYLVACGKAISPSVTPEMVKETLVAPLPMATPTATLNPSPIPTLPGPTPTSFWTSGTPTIGDYLNAFNLPTDQFSSTFLEQVIRHNQPLDDNKTFLMAYYLGAVDYSQRSLQLLRFDKTTQTWTTGEIKRVERTTDIVRPWGQFDFGDVMWVEESEQFYYIYLHANPSAGWTLLITPDLEYYDFVFGSVRSTFADGTVVYHEGMPHFVPTHFAQISLYDPETRQSRRIFPREPHQAVWLAHVEKMRQVYTDLGEDWCKEQGHHCLPELFNNGLASEIVVNDETDSLAFMVSFEPEWGVKVENVETAVVYIYRHVRQPDALEWREVKEADLQHLLGEFELAELLESGNLDLIFNEFEFVE